VVLPDCLGPRIAIIGKLFEALFGTGIDFN